MERSKIKALCIVILADMQSTRKMIHSLHPCFCQDFKTQTPPEMLFCCDDIVRNVGSEYERIHTMG